MSDLLSVSHLFLCQLATRGIVSPPTRSFSLLVQLSIFDHLFLQSCHLSLCERDILKERIMNVCMKASALVLVET